MDLMEKKKRDLIIHVLKDNRVFCFKEKGYEYCFEETEAGALKEIAKGGYGVVYHAKKMSLIDDASDPVAVAVKVNGFDMEPQDVKIIDSFVDEAEWQKTTMKESPYVVGLMDTLLLGADYADQGEFRLENWEDVSKVFGEKNEEIVEKWDRIYSFLFLEKMEPVIETVSKNKGLVRALEVCGDIKGKASFFRLFFQVGSALHTIHRLGFLHRDIKPANVFFDKEGGRFKLGDFGIARKRADVMTIGLGTQKYMAQEVLTGSYDHRADIYSFGKLSAFFLEGMQLSKDIKSYEKLINIIKKASEENAANRWETVGDMLAAAFLACREELPQDVIELAIESGYDKEIETQEQNLFEAFNEVARSILENWNRKNGSGRLLENGQLWVSRDFRECCFANIRFHFCQTKLCIFLKESRLMDSEFLEQLYDMLELEQLCGAVFRRELLSEKEQGVGIILVPEERCLEFFHNSSKRQEFEYSISLCTIGSIDRDRDVISGFRRMKDVSLELLSAVAKGRASLWELTGTFGAQSGWNALCTGKTDDWFAQDVQAVFLEAQYRSFEENGKALWTLLEATMEGIRISHKRDFSIRELTDNEQHFSEKLRSCILLGRLCGRPDFGPLLEEEWLPSIRLLYELVWLGYRLLKETGIAEMPACGRFERIVRLLDRADEVLQELAKGLREADDQTVCISAMAYIAYAASVDEAMYLQVLSNNGNLGKTYFWHRHCASTTSWCVYMENFTRTNAENGLLPAPGLRTFLMQMYSEGSVEEPDNSDRCGMHEYYVSYFSDKGPKRRENEDNFYINGKIREASDVEKIDSMSTGYHNLPKVYAVFDGIGGGYFGKLDSFIAAKSMGGMVSDILEQLAVPHDEVPGNCENDLGYALRSSLKEYHNNYLEQLEDEMWEMENLGELPPDWEWDDYLEGTTCAGVVLEERGSLGNEYSIMLPFWCGDSRVYLLHRGKLELLTKDQTIGQELVDAKKLSEDEARKSREWHILREYLGKEAVTFGIGDERRLEQGDRILICTDGITDLFRDWELEVMLASKDAVVKRLEQKVRASAEDNCTLICIDVSAPYSVSFQSKNSNNNKDNERRGIG